MSLKELIDNDKVLEAHYKQMKGRYNRLPEGDDKVLAQ